VYYWRLSTLAGKEEKWGVMAGHLWVSISRFGGRRQAFLATTVCRWSAFLRSTAGPAKLTYPASSGCHFGKPESTVSDRWV